MAHPRLRTRRKPTPKGTSVVEYAFLLSLVAAVVLGTIFAAGADIGSIFSRSATTIAAAGEGTGGTNGGGNGDTGNNDAPGTETETLFRMTVGTADDKRACVHGMHGGEPTTYCWGVGWGGALGHGSTDSSLVPVRALISGTITDIHTTVNKTCGVVGTTLWCWGDTTFTTNSPVPAIAPYPYAANVRSFVQGIGWYDCAALTDGSLDCVDAGGADHTDKASGVFDVAGSHLANASCVLLVDRTIECKGDPELGGSWGGYMVIPGLSDVDQLVGTNKTMCTLAAGTVQCWGYHNNGLLGTGETSSRPTPAPVPGAAGAISLHAESKNNAICAGMPGGDALCWGELPFGPDGAMVDVTTPTAPPGWPGGTPLVGQGFLCVALTTGGMQCMGEGPDGELGDGTSTAATGEWRDVAFPPAP